MITGVEPSLAGKILCCDLEEMTFEQIAVSRSERCPACGHGTQPSQPVEERVIRELCGRQGRRVFMVTPGVDLRLNVDEIAAFMGKQGFHLEVKGELARMGKRAGSGILSSMRWVRSYVRLRWR